MSFSSLVIHRSHHLQCSFTEVILRQKYIEAAQLALMGHLNAGNFRSA